MTSAGPPWVERSLTSLGLGLDSVDLVVTALDVVAGKPDPEGFALACERLGADPTAAVAAEDSPAGIRAARAAGVRRVVGIATTHGPDALLAAGAAEVHDDLRPWCRSAGRAPWESGVSPASTLTRPLSRGTTRVVAGRSSSPR